jgi:cell wall assembly regulator SMI1
MKSLWERFEVRIGGQAPDLLGVLNPGASEAAIREAEVALRVSFPVDFVEFYAIHNGQPRESGGLINGMTLSSLERVISNWRVLTELLEQGEFGAAKGQPEGPSKSDWWNAKWIPFAENWSGDHICLDLDPPRRGKVGQVIRFWHADAERNYEAGSFREWFESYVSGVEAGQFVFSARAGGFVDARDA